MQNLLLAGIAALFVISRVEAAEQQPAAKLETKKGKVQYVPRDQQIEIEAPVGLPLFPRDILHTFENSKATVWVKDRHPVEMGELSTLEILPQESRSSLLLSLVRGTLYFFSRETSHDVQIRTPHATGAPRGTEFLIVVMADRTLLAVYDGSARLQNEVDGVDLRSGELGVARPGQAPIKAALEAENTVQWWLYYPGVLDVDELKFLASEKQELATSVGAYRAGDLSAALSDYPGYPSPPEPGTDARRIYLAALFLGAGQGAKAETLLAKVSTDSSSAASLRWVIAAVGNKVDETPRVGASASEWLGLSYYFQACHDLNQALKAARQAVATSTNFAFGWERVAELEFSFGRIQRAEDALERSLRSAPRNAQAHALRGFVFAAKNRLREATEAFEKAIQLDSSLGNGWLGRGLVRIRKGDSVGGRVDLQTAAILEPTRSLLRSYLGKAFSDAGEAQKAALESKRAIALDERDPTPWLYSALEKYHQNRINEGVSELERSIELNENRAVYRSQLLLDQDYALRSASLAKIYQSAGLDDVSLRGAARAVSADYANSSAHLFLAESFDALRDPTRFNLRYETIWFNELLLGNLLAPVGAGQLSQHVSQQEYSRLFEANHLSLLSSTEYRSDGQFREIASQSGLFNNTAYALDLDYQHNSGVRPNNSLKRIDWYSTIKEQLTPQDSLLLIARYQDYHSGDNFQYYDPAQAKPNLTIKASQTPTLLAGYHREWAPGMHTLLLGGRLESDQRVSDRNATNSVLLQDLSGGVVGSMGLGFDLNYRSQFETYLAEAQQIFQAPHQALIVGGRYQWGQFRTFNQLSVSDPDLSFFLDDPVERTVNEGFDRISGYGYYTVEPIERLHAIAGLSYDRMSYPVNFRQPPISPGESKRYYVSPKVALVWNPSPLATVRFAYTRSLGGVSFDESVRLEPTQLAGFGQAYRTIIPESVAGSVSAPTFETFGVALDLKLSPRTYFTVEGDLLRSQVRRQLGVFTLDVITPVVPSSLGENLDYEEKALSLTLNHLAGDWWAFGALYRLSDATLDSTYPDLAPAFASTANRHEKALLHQAQLHALFQHPSGFFARAESRWYGQENRGYTTPLPGDDFFQHNIYLGYRFAQRRGEILFGVLNLAGEDYRLNPLNLYSELPRERVFMTRLLFQF